MTTRTFICQWYPPEPAEIPRSIALSMRGASVDVRVLTGIPNYPTGRVSAGYSARRVKTEVMDGLEVLRAPLFPSHDSSSVKRLANYASWAISATVVGQRLLRRSDSVLVYSSPATAALPAMVARRLWGTPYVLFVQDVWPDSIFASGFLTGPVGRVAHRVVDVFVRRAYALADHVAVTSPGMVDLLAERGVPREKLSVVHNWVPEENQGDAPVTPAKAHTSLAARVGVSEDVRLFLYAGNHGHAQGLDSVVRAFLDERTSSAHMVLVGEGIAKGRLVELAGEHPRVHFLDPVDRAEAGRLIADSDVSVVALADEPLFAITMPSKVQSGLASARPMLVVARGDAASVVVDSGAGAAALPGDDEGIVAAIRALAAATPDELASMGANGRDLYQSSMARAVGAGRLVELLDRAASRRTCRGGRPAVTHPKGTTHE